MERANIKDDNLGRARHLPRPSQQTEAINPKLQALNAKPPQTLHSEAYTPNSKLTILRPKTYTLEPPILNPKLIPKTYP